MRASISFFEIGAFPILVFTFNDKIFWARYGNHVLLPITGTHWMMEIVGLILSGGDPDQINRSLYSSCAEMICMDQDFPTSREEEKLHPLDMSPFLDVIEKAPSPRVIVSHMNFDLLPQDLLKAKVRSVLGLVLILYACLQSGPWSGLIRPWLPKGWGVLFCMHYVVQQNGGQDSLHQRF